MRQKIHRIRKSLKEDDYLLNIRPGFGDTLRDAKNTTRDFFRDAALLVSLPFGDQARKTGSLKKIAAHMETRARRSKKKALPQRIDGEPVTYLPVDGTPLSDFYFAALQKTRLKIAKIYSSQGKYDLAIGQCITMCKLAEAFKKSDTLPQAMRNYYKGKAAENSNKPDIAAACMRASCDLFLKIGKIDAALEIGEKAATLYQKEGNSTAALILCDELATVARTNFLYPHAVRFYNMAANNTGNGELAVSYRSLAEDCVQRAAKNAEAEAFTRIGTGPAI